MYMHRRRALKIIGGSCLGLGLAGVSAVYWLPASSELSLDGCLQTLMGLRGEALRSSGAWKPAAVFTHLAQSVEYSMTGYPVLKPAWFRDSAGPAAFWLFTRTGKMSHPLDERIPGAPEVRNKRNSQRALERLIGALRTFQTYPGPLKPHFAYGELSREEYAMAHVLHVNNHLTEIEVKG